MPITIDRRPHPRVNRLLSGTSLIALLTVGVTGAVTPTCVFAQTATYLTQPTTGGPANTAANVGSSSIAVGVDAHSTSSSAAGDSIAIGTAVNATAQDTIAIGAQSTASGVNAIAVGNGVVGAGPGGIGGGFRTGAGGLLVTTASGINSIAFGDNSTSSGYGAVTFGNFSSATGNGSLALGNLTTASSVGGVALGYGSLASRAAGNFTEPFSASPVTSPYGAVSVGAPGSERQITNVAGGTAATDAVNLRQLRGLGNSLATSLGGGAGFDATTNAYTAPTYTIGGVAYNSVAGAFTAVTSLAVQYTPDGSGHPTSSIDLTRGGGLGAVALTGLAAATTGSGAVSLSQLPLQYSSSGAPTTANPAVPSNDVTLLGTGGRPVTLHNVAPGALTATSTDAVSGSQLYTTNQNQAADAANIAGLRGSLSGGSIGLVQQTASTAPITVGAATGGSSVNFTNSAGTARTLTGIGAGSLSATSAEAVVGSQLYATNQTVAGLASGTLGLVKQDQTTRAISIGNGTDGTIVTLANQSGASRKLTGVAAGQIAAGSSDGVNGGQVAGLAGSVAQTLGGGAAVNADGTLSAPSYDVIGGTYSDVGGAIGGLNAAVQNIVASGTPYVAVRTIGTVSSATGDDAVAVGPAASATANGGVALGSNSVASRAGLGGAQEAFTGLSVASMAGAVSVGTVGAERQITNVAGGTADTDAVNVRQLAAVGNGLASVFGGGAALRSDGTLQAPSYSVMGNTFSDVGGAIDGLNAAVQNIDTNGTPYMAVHTTGAVASATGDDTVAIGPAASATANGGVALGANALASRAGLGGAQEAFTGLSVASTAGAVSVGSVGAERQITNVAGGTADTDAVNVRQLAAVGNGLASVFGGGAALRSDGTLQAPSYSVGGMQYANVGGALTALDQTGVKYDVDPTTGARGNAITLAGGDPNQPVLIRNVATGVAATDAANTGQVAAIQASALAYTDRSIGKVEQQIGGLGNQIASLQTDVGQARTEARQGAAIGLAAASLRFDDRPGKLSTAVGAGVWKGQGATAFGIGYSLPDGWARLNATGVTTGRDFGFAAGASFTLN